MSRINYRLADFEGPLDLLLALIRKNKMSIADVEIITIINQYLRVVRDNRDDPEAASEFIDMAAGLVYLKSVYLLPKDDEGEKLKARLQGRLTDYARAKRAAATLRSMYVGDRMFTRPMVQLPADYTYDKIHPVSDLLCAYANISAGGLKRRAPDRQTFEPIVDAPVVSVAAKIYGILKGLIKRTVTSIGGIFSSSRGKSEAVASFLAILELVRAHRVKIEKDGKLRLVRKGGGGR